MKIDNNVKSTGTGSVSETPARGGKTAGANPSAARPQSAGVQLSPLGNQLNSIEASLANVPIVDAGRVEEIKQAISEGRFKVNTEVVADRLLQTVKDLIRAHNG